MRLLTAVGLLIMLSACGGGGGAVTSSSEDSGTPSGSGDITISGKVEYVDRKYNSSGFTGDANLPVRYAKVEIVQGDNVIASGATGADGGYSISSSDTGDVYVRVLAQAG